MTNHKPRCFCYLRVSTDLQKQSHDRVRAQAKERIATLKQQGVELAFIIEEEESAVDYRYGDRPGFQQIMKAINPGDHLIVEAKDRLDRDPIAMLNCLQWLERRKVVLHCLGVSDKPLDLGDYQTQIMNYVDGMSSFHYIHWLKQRTREALAYRRDNGFAWTRILPPGRRKIVLPAKTAGNKLKPYKGLVWDEKQCQIIRDIKKMHEGGMAFRSIGRLLKARGFRTQNGGQWAHKRRRSHEWDATPVRRMYAWYCALLASGKDLGDVPLLEPAIPYVRPPPKPPKPPKPRRLWKGKTWQLRLLEKWAAEKATSSKASCPASCPASSSLPSTSSSEPSTSFFAPPSSEVCPSSATSRFSPVRSEPPCPCPSLTPS